MQQHQSRDPHTPEHDNLEGFWQHLQTQATDISSTKTMMIQQIIITNSPDKAWAEGMSCLLNAFSCLADAARISSCRLALALNLSSASLTLFSLFSAPPSFFCTSSTRRRPSFFSTAATQHQKEIMPLQLEEMQRKLTL
jgi:hypothetical protein